MKQAFLALATLFILTFSTFAQRGSSPDAMAFVAGIDLIPRVQVNTDAAESSSTAAARIERRAFQMINEKRAEIGLPQLEWNDDLASMARFHSKHMAEFKFFSHKDQEGLMVNDRADRFGLHEWRAIGENIAFNKGFDDPAAMAVKNWMDSRSHRENLLSEEWLQSAIGLAISDDGSYYFTQVFLLKK